MVVGVDRFRDHFAGHDHQDVLIGGAACELLMDDVGLDFRATIAMEYIDKMGRRNRRDGQRALRQLRKSLRRIQAQQDT